MKLTSGMRKRMPQTSFAGPNKTFPDPDIGHARKIFQLGPRSVHAGNMTMADLAKVEAKAKRKFPSIGRKKRAR